MIDADEFNDVIDVIDDTRDGDGRHSFQIFALAHAVARRAFLRPCALRSARRRFNLRRDLGIDFLLLFLPTRLDERRIKNHRDDAARLC